MALSGWRSCMAAQVDVAVCEEPPTPLAWMRMRTVSTDPMAWRSSAVVSVMLLVSLMRMEHWESISSRGACILLAMTAMSSCQEQGMARSNVELCSVSWRGAGAWYVRSIVGKPCPVGCGVLAACQDSHVASDSVGVEVCRVVG